MKNKESSPQSSGLALRARLDFVEDSRVLHPPFRHWIERAKVLIDSGYSHRAVARMMTLDGYTTLKGKKITLEAINQRLCFERRKNRELLDKQMMTTGLF